MRLGALEVNTQAGSLLVGVRREAVGRVGQRPATEALTGAREGAWVGLEHVNTGLVPLTGGLGALEVNTRP